MESIYTELALYSSTNECAMTDTVFLPISEVCDGKVSLDSLSHPLYKQTNFKALPIPIPLSRELKF